jgi:hypothetical protein
MALHWDGMSWTQVPTPNPSRRSDLNSVSADSPRDAWAVGSYFAGTRIESLALHWTGGSWTRVPSPNPGSGTLTNLESVSVLSPKDAWAVGYYFAGTREKTLVLHWTGGSWTQVPSPSPGDSALTAVSALPGRAAWSVGACGSGTLVLRWNGTSWTRVASPNPGGGSVLTGVSAVSRSDAWAVGYEPPLNPKTGSEHTVVLHWNGSTWRRS